MKTQDELSKSLKQEAKKQGFSLVGIAAIPGSGRLQLRTQALERWIKAGHQADMQWMSANKRQNIQSLLEGAQSLLAVGLNYYVDVKPSQNALLIGRYGWGKDYHKVVEKRLKNVAFWLEKHRPTCKWKICVDSSPLLDKAWAEEAGLGWIGKHSNLINSQIGSWVVIGHLLCTEHLTPDKPSKSLCGSCQSCIEACPTKAITEPFVVNSRLCLAYHTIENRSKYLPKEITNLMGNWVAGCDICQNVCPWNKKEIPNNSDPDLKPKEWVLNLTKKDAISWSDNQWKENLKGSTLKRIKPWMWRRNAKAIKEVNVSSKNP